MRILLLKNKVFWICISFWVLITLLRLINHQPWFDEAWAWILTKNLHFGSILDSLKYEGHFFVWYLMLLPFAKLDLYYPYSMFFLNWFSCFLAIVLLWQKAPFNNWLKAFITFSFPFITLYPIVARCYAIGILLLFVLSAFYKDKLKHPIIYSIIIFFCANTSIIALIGAFCFGVILLIELIQKKNMKDLKYVSIIGLITAISIIMQVAKVSMENVPAYKVVGANWMILFYPFVWMPFILNVILILISIILFSYCLFKDKKVFYSLLITNIFILAFFQFVYMGDSWHYLFIYIYLICACWIATDENKITELNKKIIAVMLTIISFCYIFYLRFEPRVFRSYSKDIANFVIEHKTSNIISFSDLFIFILPYIDKHHIVMQRYGKNYDVKDFDTLYNLYNKNVENYGIFKGCQIYEDLKKDKLFFKFSKVKSYNERYCIYKIELIEKNK